MPIISKQSSAGSHGSIRSGCLIAVVLFILPSTVGARTELSGSIGGMTLSAKEGPYIVTDNITVPENETTVIGEGCRLFFKPFTGIVVHGNLTVAGTAEQPVLFSTVNDTLSPDRNDQLPNPFDWNGIHLTRTTGTVTFSHFTVAYSVYGIKSQNESVVIENGTFQQNGQFHFTIKDAPMPVTDGIPYSYAGYSVTYQANGAGSGKVPMDAQRYREGAVVSVKENDGGLDRTGFTFAGWNSAADGGGSSYAGGTSMVMGASDVVLFAQWRKSSGGGEGDTRKTVFRKKGVPAITAGAGIVSGIVAVVFMKRWYDLEDEYATVYDPKRQGELEDEGILTSQIAAGTGAVGIAAVAAGAVLYWWWNLRGEKPVAVLPAVSPYGAGLTAVISLGKNSDGVLSPRRRE